MEQKSPSLIPSELGDEEAKHLVNLVYNELRNLARKYLGQERSGHTLQPTALVHEAYARIVEMNIGHWQDRQHFFAMAARTMRRVLVDYARKSQAEKRGAPPIHITIEEKLVGNMDRNVLLEELDSALEELARLDARQGQVVEMRFFGGLSIEECAGILNVSTRTINTDWQMAKAWLFGRIQQAKK